MGLSPRFLRRTAFGMELPGAAKGRTLICLFQRGAADALNVVVPHGEASYYALRPRIAIPRPSARLGDAQAAIDLDGFFGLHPALQPLKPLWDRGLLAPIHAVGSPSTTRSHFDAQDYMESGTPDVKRTPDGWLNRYLAMKGTCDECATHGGVRHSPFQAVAMTRSDAAHSRGAGAGGRDDSLDAFTRARRRVVGRADRGAVSHRDRPISCTRPAREMFDAVKMLRAANPQRYQPRERRGLSALAVRPAACADRAADQGERRTGDRVRRRRRLGHAREPGRRRPGSSRSGSTISRNRSPRSSPTSATGWTNVVILTMSRVRPHGARERQWRNGSRSRRRAVRDRRRVKGGKVHGKWPGLEQEQLYEGRDLALTTDFRSVFSEIAAKHLGASEARRGVSGLSSARESCRYGRISVAKCRPRDARVGC